jgi:hypothetical protein|tara:strand:- start:2043 stop:2663 length:621 start_codon:yes stop_codon:yes gene_type:complete
MAQHNNIRGWMMDGDYNAIEKVCSKFLDKDYVDVFEIGTLYGKSAIAFDDALKSVPHHITTMDVCEGWIGPSDEIIEMLGLDDNFKAMRDANRSTAEEQFDEIHRNILDRDITFIDDKWEAGYEYPVVCPDIVFYDGSHSYEETRDVLQHFCITMENGGTVVIDDYNHTQWEGLKKAVDEFIEKTGFDITSYPDSKMISINFKGKQ